MKTNHQRNFRDTRDPRVIFNDYIVFGETRYLPISHKVISASVTSSEHTNGKRGIAKDRKGAKKYINSRSRFYENQTLRKIV